MWQFKKINGFFISKIINSLLKHGIYYFTFYCVSNNVGHILLHRYVVKSITNGHNNSCH